VKTGSEREWRGLAEAGGPGIPQSGGSSEGGGRLEARRLCFLSERIAGGGDRQRAAEKAVEAAERSAAGCEAELAHAVSGRDVAATELAFAAEKLERAFPHSTLRCMKEAITVMCAS
jgi:hypothetical protein